MSIVANKVPGARAALVCDEKMASLARQHNDANILCLGGKFFDPEHSRRIVDAFLDAKFEGGRHERRVQKLEVSSTPVELRLAAVDPEIAQALANVLRNDQHQGVRIQAVDTLKRMPGAMATHGRV